MNDYRTSKVLEVQQRAFDYWSLNQARIQSQLLFTIALTEKQV
jgi:hypothetical protein